MPTLIPEEGILWAGMDFAGGDSGLCHLGVLCTSLCDFGEFFISQGQVRSLSACPGRTWPTHSCSAVEGTILSN